MNYTLSENSSWFSISSTGGSILPGDDETINITYSTSGLAIGTYTDKIAISAPGAPNSPMEITVSVTVLEQDQTYSCGHVPIYAENIISPAILILLDVSGSMNREINVSPNVDKPLTPDLSPIVQEIVDRPGWTADNAMAFIVEGSGRRTAVSYDQNSGFAPLLHVAYNDGSDYAIDVRVSQSSDDGEEKIGQTSVHLTSADLEMVDDQGNGDQIIGIRFQNLSIPQGATITEAYLEFVVDESDTATTNLTIWGEDMDNAPTFADIDDGISKRIKTSAAVAWSNIPEWGANTMEPKLDIAKATIIDLIRDRAISWGFGSWVGDREPYNSVPDYTIVHEGSKPHTPEHEAAIQDAVNALTATGNTPFAPSIEAARKYFTGAKPEDEETGSPGDTYVSAECQPKFLINITDGIGNLNSTVAGVNTNTAALADEEVSPIAVGFGLPPDQAEQIYEMAKVANEKGNVSETDDIFALHEELAGVGQPFFAYSKQELIDAMTTITE
ncbi:MAG: VWA domain-containing protein, partial [Desulfobacterales bacterium]|nr:VWA domain-containing protein [Desulfobacterales bacterium]